MVAIPVYDGKLPIETARCLFNEFSIAKEFGDDLQFNFLGNCSHAAMGRNQLAQGFMDSDSERLIFLDADITFEAGALVKIAHRAEDFVGGAYRYKLDEESYPIGLDTSKEFLQANESGLLEVLALPGGFLSLSKNVFETLSKPEREFTHFGKTMQCWFQMRFEDGKLWGEDSYFCKEWRDSGGQVFLDPEIEITHWDFNKPYVGHVGRWLKNRGT